MPPRSQQVGEVLATGLSLPTNSVLIAEEIDSGTVRLVWTAIQAMDKEGATIDVALCTSGGYCLAGFAIYDLLRSCKANIRITGYGKVYSMGTVILQAGDERRLSPNTQLLIHPSYIDGGINEPNIAEAEIEVENHKLIDGRTTQILAERMALPLEQFRLRFPRSTYLSAQEALDLGLADSIAT